MERQPNEIRPVTIQRGFTCKTPGSVLYQCGGTTVLCTASVDENVPPWMADSGKGWITGEYNMLPGSTSPRKKRDRKKVDGRTTEIQRLIGRSMRAVANLQALGPRQITVDCDVLEADGGTRTASITGALIALVMPSIVAAPTCPILRTIRSGTAWPRSVLVSLKANRSPTSTTQWTLPPRST